MNVAKCRENDALLEEAFRAHSNNIARFIRDLGILSVPL